jgi:ribonuclease E
MTEGEGKRRYWRRGRRKKAAEPETGAAAEAPSAAEGAGEPEGAGVPEDPEGRSPQDGYEPPVAAFAAEDGTEGAGDAAGEGAGAAAEAGAESGARKKPRRRGRRRRKPSEGAAPQAADAIVPPPGADVPDEAAADEVEEPETPLRHLKEAHIAAPSREPEVVPPEPAARIEAAVPYAAPSEEGAPEELPLAAHPTAQPPEGSQQGAAPQGEPSKRRRRRRRRRRGKGGAQGEAGAQGAPAGAGAPVAGEESFGEAEINGVHAAGLTDVEEPEEPARHLEEAEEEETEEEEGKGPRKVMLIDGMHPEENRVAIVAEGVLDYYEVENQRKKAFKGNIYKGKVVNIAPAIEAAFVEFGGGRHGFLPLNEYCAGALMDHLGTWNEGDKRPPLRPGMEILVQVTKEESTIKGAALTSYISIAGRYMVMMLGMKRYGISKKITGEKERERIRKHMEKLEYPEHLGFIVRTVGAARPLKDLKADLQNLLKLWDRTVAGARANKAPALLYEEQDIVIRTLRDNYSADVAEVMMNSEAAFRKAEAFFDVYYPKQKGKLKLYRQKRPLFARFNLEEQVERATARKVPLPSGGHICIDHTEAIWTIDVNSGRSSKDRDIEDTAFRTNKEAAAEVTRQMRLRDIGGLIVVDFIDMENKAHNKEVDRILKEGLKKDKAKSDVTSLGKFGLVAISRQRMGTSFYDVLLKSCEVCNGLGVVPTRDSSVVRLFRKLHDELSKDQKDGARDVTVRVAPGLLETLINQKRDDITRIERMCGGKVTIQADPSLPPSSFALGPPANGGKPAEPGRAEPGR